MCNSIVHHSESKTLSLSENLSVSESGFLAEVLPLQWNILNPFLSHIFSPKVEV